MTIKSREESMLRQVVSNAWNPAHMPFEDFFIIDQSLPEEVIRQIATPADVAAALNCWRNMMVAAVDAVVERLSVLTMGDNAPM